MNKQTNSGKVYKQNQTVAKVKVIDLMRTGNTSTPVAAVTHATLVLMTAPFGYRHP